MGADLSQALICANTFSVRTSGTQTELVCLTAPLVFDPVSISCVPPSSQQVAGLATIAQLRNPSQLRNRPQGHLNPNSPVAQWHEGRGPG